MLFMFMLILFSRFQPRVQLFVLGRMVKVMFPSDSRCIHWSQLEYVQVENDMIHIER